MERCDVFDQGLAFKRSGGQRVQVVVSDGIWPPALLPLLFAALVAHCGGCTPADDGESTAAGADVAKSGDAAPACDPTRQDLAGGCCPLGSFYEFSGDRCVAVGPPRCAGLLADRPQDCRARWCYDWRTDVGAQCTPSEGDCWLEARSCTPDEIATESGCPAGQWPDPAGDGACTPPGQSATMSGGLAPPGLDDSGLPMLPPMPVEAAPRWCWQGDDVDCWADTTACHRQARVCTAAERSADGGCPAGQAPGSADGSCVPAGVDWTCPPGFVAKGVGTGKAPPGCVPDPSDCPSGKWPEVVGGKVLYVDAAAPAGGTGTAGAPFHDLIQAINFAPSGSTLALAAGTYQANIAPKLAVRVVGRCAHLVRIDATGLGAAVLTKGAAPAGPLELDGLTLQGQALGIAAQGGWQIVAHRVHVTGALAAGLMVQQPGSRLTIIDSYVEKTVEIDAGYGNGNGALVYGKGELRMRRVRLSANVGWGLRVDGEGARAVGEQILIDSTVTSPATKSPGMGATVAKGGRLDLLGASLVANRRAGLLATGAASQLHASGLRIEGTRAEQPANVGGVGLLAQAGAKVMLLGAELHDNLGAGLAVMSPDSEFRAGGLRVTATQHKTEGEKAYAHGVSVQDYTRVSLIGTEIVGNSGIGLLAQGVEARLEATDLRIDATVPWQDGSYGWGVLVTSGADVTLRRAQVARSKTCGIRVDSPTTLLKLHDVLISETSAAGDSSFITGLGVAHEAKVRFSGLRLAKNVFYGLRAESGAVIHGAGLLADHGVAANLMFSSDAGLQLLGTANALMVMAGAQLHVCGARLSEAIFFSVTVSGEGTRVALNGTLVDHTLAEPWEGVGGVALDVSAKGELRVNDTELVANRSATAVIQEGTLAMARSVLRHTRSATYDDLPGRPKGVAVEMADGILGLSGAVLHLEHNLLFANPRSGLLAGDRLKATLTGNVIIGNGFGVVSQGGMELDVSGNLVANNPQGNVVVDGELAIVKPPVLAP